MAATPEPYRWYRLFPDCQYEALQDVAQQATDHPNMLVVTGDWQAKLVVAGLTSNASRVWFDAAFFTSKSHRDGVMGMLSQQGRPAIVVVDSYLVANRAADTKFLASSPWQEQGPWCQGAAGKPSGFHVYVEGLQ